MIWDCHLTQDCIHIQYPQSYFCVIMPTYSLLQTVSPRHVFQINEGMVEEIIKGQSHLRLSLEKTVKQVSAWLWHFWLFRYLKKPNKCESFKTCACIYVLNRTCNALLLLACNDSKWCLPSLVSSSSRKVLPFQCCLLNIRTLVLFWLRHAHMRKDTRLSECTHVCVPEKPGNKATSHHLHSH